jgi:hypothetical protein
MSKTRTYQVLSPIDFGGELGFIRPFDEAGTPVPTTVELDDDTALPLELVGAIVLVDPQPEKPAPKPTKAKPNEASEA